MKLSQAILIGCTLRPRKILHYFVSGNDGACALGAAIAAIGIDKLTIISNEFPILNKFVAPPSNAFDRAYNETVFIIIEKLNDVCGWSREQIAFWVATLEDADEPIRIKEKAHEAVASHS